MIAKDHYEPDRKDLQSLPEPNQHPRWKQLKQVPLLVATALGWNRISHTETWWMLESAEDLQLDTGFLELLRPAHASE